jgi:5-methylcytosine-specific restriction endonuclease McrA
MTFIKHKKVNGYYYLYLCKTYRDKYTKKVKTKTLLYLGKDKNLSKLPFITLDKCSICSSKKDLVTDHIIPLSLGGDNNLLNLQALCKECNFKKGKKLI